MLKRTSILAIFALMIFLGGCGMTGLAKPEPEQGTKDEPIIPPTPTTETVTVTLYFSDWQAQHVVPETREVNQGNMSLEELVVTELIKGPEEPHLYRSLPENLKLLSVDVVEEVAYVNLSSEMNKVQGSAGTFIALHSLINTMTELEGINKVQILVEGNKWNVEGHGVASPEPMGRNIITWPILIDEDRVTYLQEKVDNGEEQWRLNSLESARHDARMAGFYLTDEFELMTIEDGIALVTVNAHDGNQYLLELIQPATRGETGIWILADVNQR